MRTTYQIGRTVVDLVEIDGDLPPYVGECQLITRVLVGGERGTGLGREIMEQVLQDADAEGVRLLLEPISYGEDTGLSQAELISWYGRLGFTWDGGGAQWMEREPR